MKFKGIKPGMVIHCSTEEDARALLEHLKEIGYECVDYMMNAWKRTKEETCFEILEVVGGGATTGYGDVEYYKSEGYEITEFSDLIDPEPRFKVGDKVRIRKDLQGGKYYGGLYATVEMAGYRGKTSKISKYHDDVGEYYLQDFEQFWNDEMLEPVDDSPINSDTDSPMTAVEVLEWLKNNGGEKNNAPLYEAFGFHYAGSVVDAYDAQEIIDKITAYEAAKKAPKPVEVEEGYYCCIYKASVGRSVDDYVLWGVDKQTAEADAKGKALKRTEETGEQMRVCVEFTCRAKEDES